MPQRDSEVLVAGAGPVGLTCALALARGGHSVEVVDEAHRRAGHSYALALHSDTLALFDELEVSREVLGRALKIESVALYSGHDRRGEMSLSTLGGPHPYLAVLPQADLEGLLEAALGRLDVPVRWSHRMARFEQGPAGVAVDVDELVKESVGYAVAHTEWVVGRSEQRLFDHLVGADGHRSVVRRQLGFGFPAVSAPQLYAVFEITTDEPPPPEVRLTLDEQGASVLWPLPGRRCRWSFELPPGALPRNDRAKDRLFVQLGPVGFPVLSRDLLEELIADRAPWFDRRIEDVEWRMAVRFERRLAPAFGIGRVALVGDAGHTAGPLGVQSMNVGVQEAASLARALSAGDPKGALDAWREGRLIEWRKLLGISERLTTSPAADPWLADHLDRLQGAIPASGSTLATLAAHLGLRCEARPQPSEA